MIYLIESFMRDDNECPLRCLKIGYAKDVEDRMKAYKTYNPSVKLLKTREGEHDLENYLHKYFKRYELSNFNEWFIYSNKIIDNFELIDIQEETISLDEYLEYVRKEILFKIIPETYEIAFSKILPLLDELEREFNEGRFNNDNLYSKFPRDLCNTRIKEILNYLKDKEIDYYEDFDFSDIRMDFPQIMGRQRLKENIFRDECIFIYKLSDVEVTLEEFERLSKQKIKVTMDDIKNGELLSSSQSKANLINDIRLRIQVKKYKDDYTGIDEKTGLPKINKLVLISERRAFELRSNVYKTDVMIYNEFNKVQSVEVSFDEYLEKTKAIDSIRQSFGLNGSFESKMRLVCDFLLNPRWFGKILISDLFWLPLNYRNYLNLLGPEKIKAKTYYEAEIKREIQQFTNSDVLKTLFIDSFTIGEKIFLKDVKERIRKIYINLGISKTPKAVDLLEYFEVREYMSLNKETGKRLAGYEIIKIKD